MTQIRQIVNGPWRAITGTYQGLVLDAGGLTVAITPRQDRERAIGRLIAAAPDLLEAAQKALPFLKEYEAALDDARHRGGHYSAMAEVALLEAAIARATGEEEA